MPTVSVIIPTYNRAHYLPQAIESVLSQSFTDFEIIVIDDGSTDDTEAVIQPFLVDDRLQYVKQPNAGVAAARNAGMRLAQGRYLAFLDSDDWFLPGKLKKQVAYMAANPHIALSYTAYFAFDDITQKQTPRSVHKTYYHRMFSDCPVFTSTVMLRRKVWKAVGELDTTMRLAEDIDYWIRIAHHYPLGHITEMLTGFRLHPGNHDRDPNTILKAHLHIAEKQFPQPGFTKRRITAAIYIMVGQQCLSAQPRRIRQARIHWLAAVWRYPFSPDFIRFTLRLIYRAFTTPRSIRA